MKKSSIKRKEINELKGEIELKASTVKSSQTMFAKELQNGLGKEIKEKLKEQEEKMKIENTVSNTKKNFWQKLKENFKKINS